MMSSLKSAINAIKLSVTMVRVLNDNGILVPDKVPSQIHCFAHDDIHPSARVYPNTNAVYCWTCNKLFDVISAYMLLNQIEDLKFAVLSMVGKYGVVVEASPEKVERFYKQAMNYNKGDVNRIKDTITRLGEDFRIFYQKIDGWKHISHVIDYLWERYDRLYADPHKPKELIQAAVEWYDESTSLVASYRDQCKALEELVSSQQGAINS